MAALSVMEFSVKHSARSAGRMLGFTLTELLIVIAVFAILMGIALPNFSASENLNDCGHARLRLLC